MMTSQILWRFTTFYLMLLISGLVASLYHSKPRETFRYATRQTYIDMQLASVETDKMNFDTLYETKQLSRKSIERRVTQSTKSWGLLTGDDYVGIRFSKNALLPSASKSKMKTKKNSNLLD